MQKKTVVSASSDRQCALLYFTAARGSRSGCYPDLVLITLLKRDRGYTVCLLITFKHAVLHPLTIRLEDFMDLGAALSSEMS